MCLYGKLINNNVRINSVLHTHNCKPTFAITHTKISVLLLLCKIILVILHHAIPQKKGIGNTNT